VTALDSMLAPTAPDNMLQVLHPISGHSTMEWLVGIYHDIYACICLIDLYCYQRGKVA
jgi:hypothetical protein